MRVLLLILVAAGSVVGQNDLFDLATTGDGAMAYFVSALALHGETSRPRGSPGRIFQIGSDGLRLFLERPIEDPPPSPGPGLIEFTNYYDLSRPQTSRDGTVIAVTGRRDCYASSACYSSTTLQTTITGLPGGTMEVVGAGRLSGNGRYLLLAGDGSLAGRCASVVDLQTRQQTLPMTCAQSPGPDGSGKVRAVADDGTAVTGGGFLYVIRGSEVTQLRPVQGSLSEAVIDSAARSVVYSDLAFDTARRSIRTYTIATQQDSALVDIPGADIHQPSLSADGRRVLFLSDASGLPQIYTIETNGGEPRQISHDGSGVLSSAMSDDGHVAWYFSGAARLYRMDLETGVSEERLGRTPQLGYIARTTAGSLFSIPGAGLSDATYVAQSYPLPHSLGGVSVRVNGVDSPLLSVSPSRIVLQVPFQTPALTNGEVTTQSDSAFVPLLDFATTSLAGFGAFLPNPGVLSVYGGMDALTAHQDWSALVTPGNPAKPGEILHLYGTGFGPVDSQPPDGMPAPADPPARTVTPVTCSAGGADNTTTLDIPVLYAGLAPGLTGIYQLDVRLPEANLRPSVQLSCKGAGDNSGFFGSFAVQPVQP